MQHTDPNFASEQRHKGSKKAFRPADPIDAGFHQPTLAMLKRDLVAIAARLFKSLPFHVR